MIAVVFFSATTVSAATNIVGSTFSSTDGTSGKLVINSVDSSISGSTWNVSMNCTINMVNSWLYTGGLNYDRYFSATINGVSGPSVKIKDKTESWYSGTTHNFTYNMSLPVNPDQNVLAISLKVVDGNGNLSDVATFNSGNGYTVSLKAVQKATGLTLNLSSKTLYTNETFTIVPTVTPSNTYDKTAGYTSSNTTVATVSNTGVVTAKKAGSAVITVNTMDGSNLSKTVSVTVKQYVTSISLNVTQPTLYTGETLALTASVSPSDASSKTLTYESSDTSVATIDQNGHITALKAGSTNITVLATDGSGVSKTITLTVKQRATYIDLLNPISELYIGSTHQLDMLILPEDTSDKSVTYTSTNPLVASISDSGLITPHSRGLVTIIISTNDSSDLHYNIAFTVKQYVEGITLQNANLTLYTGESETLYPTVFPEDADNKAYTFTSSDSSVAIVNEIGKVTAIKAGSTTVTVSAVDGSGVSADAEITVKQYAEDIRLIGSEILLSVGDSYDINSTVLPEDTTDKALQYESNDTNVLTVNEYGTIYAKNPGNTDVIITATDRRIVSTTLHVEVVKPVEEIKVESSEIELYTGHTKTIAYTVYPTDATNKNVSFISDHPEIASVNQSGEITALSSGSAIITLTAADGSGVIKIIDVVIRQSISSLTIENNDIALNVGECMPLDVLIDPIDAYNKELTYTSSDPSVASVDNNGNITALSSGKTVINIRSTDQSEKELRVEINVTNPVKSIKFEKDSYELTVGEKLLLTVSILPNDADNKDVIFESSNEDIVRINSRGKITAVQEGSAFITVYSKENSEVTDNCIITIKSKDVSIPVTSDEPLNEPKMNDETVSETKDHKDTYEEGITDETTDSDTADTVDLTITREPMQREEATKKYNWHEYLFVGLGALSFLTCLIYLIFFLKRRKDESESDKYDEKKE